MVYAGKAQEREIELGVSGRLLKRNLVMWDPQTNSLWSQLRGEALSGPLKGTRLDMLPAVFVPMETWRRMYPETRVLDLSPVRREAWYFKGADLARGHVEEDGLGLGLRGRSGNHLVDLRTLQQRGVMTQKVDEATVLCCWIAEDRAALVYRLPESMADWSWSLDAKDIVARNPSDNSETIWIALTGRSIGAVPPLERYPYIPTYTKAWHDHF